MSSALCHQKFYWYHSRGTTSCTAHTLDTCVWRCRRRHHHSYTKQQKNQLRALSVGLHSFNCSFIQQKASPRRKRRSIVSSLSSPSLSSSSSSSSPSSLSSSTIQIQFVSPFNGSVSVPLHDVNGDTTGSLDVPENFIYTQELALAGLFENQSVDSLKVHC